MKDALFILFCLFTILSAAGVVISKSAIYSAFSLLISFLGLAGIYLLWGSDLLALFQILVYAGAIVVLFVFVVMMVQLKPATSDLNSKLFVFGSGVVSWFLSHFILLALNQAEITPRIESFITPDSRQISFLLFSEYLWAFEILSLFLTALIVSVCVLASEPKVVDV